MGIVNDEVNLEGSGNGDVKSLVESGNIESSHHLHNHSNNHLTDTNHISHNDQQNGEDVQQQQADQSLLSSDLVNSNNPLKIVVVGDGTVGKTCMCIAYTQGIFPDSEYVPTVFENYTGIQNYRGSNYQLALWDTAGQEDYERLRPLSYPGTNVFLLCFSVANFNSYQNITAKWYPEIREHAPKVPFILVGTKCDLRPEDESSSPWYRSKCIDSMTSQSNGSAETFITTDTGRKLARRLNASGYVECSAKSLVGIENVILEAIKAGIGDEDKKHRCIVI